MEKNALTYGSAGLRFRPDGVVDIGREPTIVRQGFDHVVDMNPTTIGLQQLIDLLEEQRIVHPHSPVHFLGHVIVLPEGGK